jgi:LmbE family N-acetylglucosaminyl deacetylase
LAALSLLLPASAGGQSLPEAVEAIDRARVTTRILCITAHPDDEPAGLLSYLARGLGADVALLSVTRGEGGQNALGPEQGAQLAALRSQELLAATRIYGVRLYFTRAPDLGFVKTVEGTHRIWEGTAFPDMVRVIRTFRPNIVINSWGGVHEGHGHHQTTGVMVPQAVAAAADPKMFPEQLNEGVSVWRVEEILERYRGNEARGYLVPTDQISPLWGRTYNEIGRDGDLQHRTQGIAGFLNGPFLRFKVRVVTDRGDTPDTAGFGQKLPSLADRYPDLAGERATLENADRALAAAKGSALALDWPAASLRLAEAGKDIRSAIGTLPGDAVRQTAGQMQALSELEQIRDRINTALALAADLRVEAQSSRKEIVPGESFTVSVSEQHREKTLDAVEKPNLILPPGWTSSEQPQEKDSGGGVRFEVRVPPDAAAHPGAEEWMLPEPPPLVSAAVAARVGGYEFRVEGPVVLTHASSTRVETLPIQMVPQVTLTLEPRQILVVAGRRGAPLEVVARVRYYGSKETEVEVGMEAPQGWSAGGPVRLQFDGPGDQLARLEISLPRNAGPGSMVVPAFARMGTQTFRTSVEPLPTLPSRLWSAPAAVAVRILDLTVPANLRVGYIAAENDPIPDILREVGIHVDLLDPAALAFGNLSRFDAVAIGIRAYELRSDLARANRRLLEYAAAGGTLVVQYQRPDDFNRIAPAPYPAKVGRPTLRITDPNSPVRILAPGNTVLNLPNAIRPKDFDGWVQERGLYFLGEYDPRFTPMLALSDPGEAELRGGLLVAKTGKGTYTYTGLSFFRQLPEGVNGALRLFINVLSQSRAPQKAAGP